jgi:hypothetical protein
MVVMAVTEHEGVDSAQVETELLGVLDKRRALPRVEEQATARDLDPGGEAKFRPEARAGHVVDDDCDLGLVCLAHRLTLVRRKPAA